MHTQPAALRKLLILRHAHAAAPTSEGDRLRPLTLAGKQEARECGALIGALFKDGGTALLVSSHAARARQTAQAVKAGAGNAVTLPRTDELMYNASANTLSERIRLLSDAAECVMIVAHNPGVSALCAALLDRCAGAPSDAERFLPFSPCTGMLFGACEKGFFREDAQLTLEARVRPDTIF